MYKLWATIKKDVRVLLRDKVGLTFMFLMPIMLAIIITAVQNSTFELVNDNKITLLICNRDKGEPSTQLLAAINKIGMFEVKQVSAEESDEQIKIRMHAKDALIAVIVPTNFSAKIISKSEATTAKALNNFGLDQDSSQLKGTIAEPITLFYHPVLQESFRQSIRGSLYGALQLVENKQVLKSLYLSLNDKAVPENLENDIIQNQVPIKEIPVSRDGSRNIPNATQHNIPSWTIFAMFFIVISLGSSVVREKLNGSFLRLKTLPTSYLVSLFSKQITYLLVTLLQAAVIFAIGIWLFPSMGLPRLNIPADIIGLCLVTILVGWCAVSYAICIGVFAQTQEQANGIGAVSIVLLAAIGGLLVPSFAMPESFQNILILSPLHWCLEAFYGLFLEGGSLRDILMNILPLFAIIIIIQLITLWGLKRKNLI